MTTTATTASRRSGKKPPLSMTELTRWVAEDSVLLAGEETPFRATLAPGDPRLAVITGENASGKSLFARVICAKATTAKMAAVSLSIRERAGAGTNEMARMRQTFMYGDESEKSTGATTVQVTRTAFNNLDRDQGSLLLLDEPEMGLSDGYAAALGRYIAQQTKTIPDVCAGVIVVSHNRPLVRNLAEEYGTTPTFIHLTPKPPAELAGEPDEAGPAPAVTLESWLTNAEVRSIDELLALPDVGLDRFRSVIKLLRD